jgi:hypothetical protein
MKKSGLKEVKQLAQYHRTEIGCRSGWLGSKMPSIALNNMEREIFENIIMV